MKVWEINSSRGITVSEMWWKSKKRAFLKEFEAGSPVDL
jgi:hypothetical protein